MEIELKVLFFICTLCIDSLWSLFQLQLSVVATCPCSGSSQTSEMTFMFCWVIWHNAEKIHWNWSQNDDTDVKKNVWPVQWRGSAGASLCTPPPVSLHSPPPGPHRDLDLELPQCLRRLRCLLSPNIPGDHKSPKSQSHCLSGLYNLCSEQHPLSLDPRLEWGKTCNTEKNMKEQQNHNLQKQHNSSIYLM